MLESVSLYNQNGKKNISLYIEDNDIIKKWLNSLDVLDDTKKTYLYHLTLFFKWLKSNNITIVSKGEILNYKNHLIKVYSSSSVCLKISILKSFYGYLEEENITPNIVKNIKGAKIAKGFKRDMFTLEQIKAILQIIDTSSILGQRNYALINLLFRTGIRSCEIYRANIEDIQCKDGQTVLYIQGKGRIEKDEFVVITPCMLDILNNYLKAREQTQHITDTSPLFISVSDRNFGERLSLFSIRWCVKNLLRNAGIDSKRLTTHSTRHTAISLSLLSGADLLDVKEMARHQSMDTTLLYTHNLKRLINAPEKMLEKVFENM